jgi:hypothetical protein
VPATVKECTEDITLVSVRVVSQQVGHGGVDGAFRHQEASAG